LKEEKDKMVTKADSYYKQNLYKIITKGNKDENPRPKYKDGTPANSLFITQIFEEYDVENGELPFTTLRNTAVKSGIKEIFWIYQLQSSKLEEARKLGINWWDEWEIGDGTIGQRYGATVRKWDLMNKLLHGLKQNPFGRRHVLNLYQESDLLETEGLYPCAFETIWSVRKDLGSKNYKLDMTLIQRSSDYIIANWINKAQYYALQLMVASDLGYKPGKFCHYVHNLHIYDRHLNAANEILKREPLEEQPNFTLKVSKNFYEININDFEFINFDKPQKISSELEIAV
jgi:thymidylate synthase